MESHRNLTKPIRCPKCRSKKLTLSEHTPGKITSYSQDELLTISKIQETTDVTGEQYVMGQCECGNTWRVRGVQSISQLSYAQVSEEIPT